jgi:WD repeat-containing protein 26
MRSIDSDQDSNISVSPDYSSEAGPSSSSFNFTKATANGNSRTATTNGFGSSATNGFHSSATNGASKLAKAIARVELPGTFLYDDETFIDREEYIRLVIQSLRDVGYT